MTTLREAAHARMPVERTWAQVFIAASALALLMVVLVTTFTHVIAPRLFSHYERLPSMASAPRVTTTKKGAMADPVNVALVGTGEEIERAFKAAGWTIADSLSRASDIGIAKSVLLNRPDSSAPVSNLFLLGRKQDVAFEREVGSSARHRHHVRLWLYPSVKYDGRDLWIGDASYDASAGMSHRALRPTHHIAPDIDDERDGIELALARVGQVAATFRVTGIGLRVDGHNAEGDRFYTDGELRVIVISPGNSAMAAPVDPGVPPLVASKDWIWTKVPRFLK